MKKRKIKKLTDEEKTKITDEETTKILEEEITDDDYKYSVGYFGK